MSSSLTKYLLDQIKWLGYDVDIEACRISDKDQDSGELNFTETGMIEAWPSRLSTRNVHPVEYGTSQQPASHGSGRYPMDLHLTKQGWRE